jgi:Protein of unknown function (DUF1598)
MSHRHHSRPWWLAAAGLILALATLSHAGHSGIGRFGAVGGVSIQADGVVAAPIVEARRELREHYLKDFKPIAAELNQPVELRKISLKAIEEACAEADKQTTYYLPDEIRFLAGIQRIQYVFVYPEENDIVLAGPGEGWKIDEDANYVGVTTGRPVLRLEDLIVALRTVHDARQGGITVSIDPTEEGRRRLNELKQVSKQFTPATAASFEKALGPQQITITGVPDTSRFARMLFCSDYHMKRIAMKLDASPVKGLPSYVDMLKQGSGKPANMMPRWWLACNYEPLAKSPDGLAWEIRGPGVKAMTEDELIGEDGSVKGTGKANPAAQKWADLMTAKYDELSVKQPVFGELRNLMDLCVVAALITKEDMLAKAKLEIPTIAKKDSKMELTHWHAPKTVPTQVSVTRGGGDVIVTASGGVEITSWQVADKSVENAAVGEVRAKAAKPGSLWWN